MKPEHAEIRYPTEPARGTRLLSGLEAEKCEGDVYLGDAYDMQVWRNADSRIENVWGYILADPDKPATFKSFSYTMFMMDPDGNLSFNDKDVIVTAAHLAEIYRVVADHMASDEYDPALHINTDEEKD